MKPIHKFNNGRGAMLCNTCRTIISTGPATKELYCEKCKPKQENDYTALLKPVGTKQETLEEAKERSYSEEEVYHILCEHTAELFKGSKMTLTEWFEQYKKK